MGRMVGAAQSPVIIAPTRGSNMSQSTVRPTGITVIIAPTRGSNEALRAELEAAREVIIAPTRGSNGTLTPTRFAVSGGSSSPLRGAATGRLHLRDSPCPGGHHRPYEGQQHHRERRMRGRHGGHHRPYEGQQRDAYTYEIRRVRGVIIAPTRGSNIIASAA